MKHAQENERRVLNLARLRLPEIPVFGRYQYSSVHPGLATHTHPTAIEICYLESGCQTYRAGGREYHLVGGDIFVTGPGEPHDTGGHPEDRGILYWLNLRIPKPGRSLLMLPPSESATLVTRLSGVPQKHFCGRPILKQIFNEVFDLYDQPDNPLKCIAIANLLVRCILEVIDCGNCPESQHRSAIIARIVERVRTYPERDYSLAELAEEASLSLSRFKTKFKAEMGIAPHEFVLRCKMDAAKHFLLHGKRSVTDTAMQLGFSSSQYFATVFKRFTRQTPAAFSASGPSVALRPGRLQLRG